MHSIRHAWRAALVAAVVVTGSIAVAPAASAATTSYAWTGGSDFDDTSVYFGQSEYPASLHLNTASGYAHSHSGTVTVSIVALPSGIPIWTSEVSTDTSMNVTTAVPAAVWPLDGIRVTSSPYQGNTFHSFSYSDTIDLVSGAGPTPTVTPQCRDGLDNDLNGSTDYPYDPGCDSPDDSVELSIPPAPPQCRDGLDNDLNGKTDYPNDPGCASWDDDSETSPAGPCPLVLGVAVCTSVTTGSVRQPVVVSSVATGVAATYHEVGEIDIYRFALPTGGSATLPCVVLTHNGTQVNPCKAAGGTYVSRTALLYERDIDQPSVALTGTLFAANVCNATVTVTAGGFGVEDFPALTIC